jgi:glutathione S-transferase
MKEDPMLTLHGFAISNYYNKVKLALLEKGVPFEEKHEGVREKTRPCWPLRRLARSPTSPPGTAACAKAR